MLAEDIAGASLCIVKVASILFWLLMTSIVKHKAATIYRLENKRHNIEQGGHKVR